MLVLCFRNTDEDRPIADSYRVGGYVHHGGHLNRLPGADVELPSMPRADDIEAFDHSIPQRTIIVRANITNRKELPGDVENYNRLIAQVNKETFAVWEFRGGRDL